MAQRALTCPCELTRGSYWDWLRTALLAAAANTIGGGLQAFRNIGGSSFVNNRMNGNMQCKENEPAPTGGGNRSPGKEDQCARL